MPNFIDPDRNDLFYIPTRDCLDRPIQLNKVKLEIEMEEFF